MLIGASSLLTALNQAFTVEESLIPETIPLLDESTLLAYSFDWDC